MKKVISLVMSVLLVIGMLSVSVLAAGTPTIQVSKADARPGDTVTVTVSLENNPGIACFELVVSYDTSRLEWTGVSVNEEMGGSWDAAVGETILWVNADNYTQNGEIFSLTFNVLDSAKAGDADVSVSYEDGEVFDENEQDVSFVVSAGGVTIKAGGADLNKDGVTDLRDIICLMKHIVGAEKLDETEADITVDGKVNILDVIRFVRYLAGADVELY